jgi:hypothetical protein
MTTEARWMTLLDETRRLRFSLNHAMNVLNTIDKDLIVIRDENDLLRGQVVSLVADLGNREQTIKNLEADLEHNQEYITSLEGRKF